MTRKAALPASPLAALGAKGKPRKGTAPGASKPSPPAVDRRRRTVYLTPDVDRLLRLYAAETDAEISELVTEAVRVYLAARAREG